MLKPNEAQQMEALWQSMANILWNIGERQKVLVVLPGDIPHIPHSHTYFQDSVTEKLYFFEFLQLDDLQIFLKRYLYYVSITLKGAAEISCRSGYCVVEVIDS